MIRPSSRNAEHLIEYVVHDHVDQAATAVCQYYNSDVLLRHHGGDSPRRPTMKHDLSPAIVTQPPAEATAKEEPRIRKVRFRCGLDGHHAVRCLHQANRLRLQEPMAIKETLIENHLHELYHIHNVGLDRPGWCHSVLEATESLIACFPIPGRVRD